MKTKTSGGHHRGDTNADAVRLPGSSWRPPSRLLTPRDAPGRWTPRQRVGLRRTRASPSSRDRVPPPELSAQSEKMCETSKSSRHAAKYSKPSFAQAHLFRSKHWFTLGFSLTLTFICQAGMKSALCRTRSKIFCSWGLMKALSGERTMEGWGVSRKVFIFFKNIPLLSILTRRWRAGTLYAEHLSDLERGPADFAQCVDYSLGVGLRQERGV